MPHLARRGHGLVTRLLPALGPGLGGERPGAGPPHRPRAAARHRRRGRGQQNPGHGGEGAGGQQAGRDQRGEAPPAAGGPLRSPAQQHAHLHNWWMFACIVVIPQ